MGTDHIVISGRICRLITGQFISSLTRFIPRYGITGSLKSYLLDVSAIIRLPSKIVFTRNIVRPLVSERTYYFEVNFYIHSLERRNRAQLVAIFWNVFIRL